MLNQEVIKELEDSILKVIVNGTEVQFDTKELTYCKHKYSSSKEETLTLFLDGERMPPRKEPYPQIEYKCSCGRINKISLLKFLLKKRLRCRHCAEDSEKIQWHKEYFKQKRLGLERGNKGRPKRYHYDFSLESQEFQDEYFKKHLTKKEFFKLLPHIATIDGHKAQDRMGLLEHEACLSQHHYRSMVTLASELIPFRNIVLKCPCCGVEFKTRRPLKKRVEEENYKCQNCLFTNQMFQIKQYGDALTYQSNLELEFIKKCEVNSIAITNGQIVPYEWRGSHRAYHIDFYLPEKEVMVEIKDNHKWHKEQLDSGKWQAKELAAREYCFKHGLQYTILFPNDIDEFIQTIKDIV